jgi:hypothetical protein
MEGILNTPAQVFAVANIRSVTTIRENLRAPITGGLWLPPEYAIRGLPRNTADMPDRPTAAA